MEKPYQNKNELLARCEQIRLATTGIVAKHINKRFSLPISRWVVTHTRWTPNQITYFNIFLGLLSGFVASKGTLFSLFIGGLLFQIVSIMDGVDGEVAKLTNTSSQWGQWLDTISDNGSLASFMIGISVGLYRIDPQGPVISLTITTFGAIAFMIGTMLIFLKKETNSGSLVTYDKEFLSTIQPDQFPIASRAIHALKYGVKKDFYSLIFFLACLFQKPSWVLYLCAYGGIIACVFMAYIHIMTWIDRECGSVPLQGERFL
ncbi:MAG: CDP-alcohol phosphatidyltransferase family protein [Deltaproteobacteria bacterium]|nr:MAG: CDP-alcohol phosphatidyltransferase family protein [Deltaproteobacteria bacterium]